MRLDRSQMVHNMKNSDRERRRLEDFKTFPHLYRYLIETLELSIDNEVFRQGIKKYYEIKNLLPKENNLGRVGISGLVFLYLYLKEQEIDIDPKIIQNVLGIKPSNFQNALKNIYSYYFEYQKHKRIEIIRGMINQCERHFELESKFSESSELILKTYFPYLQFASENLIAGSVIVLTLILLHKLEPRPPMISRYFDVKKRSVGTIIRREIFEKRGFNKSKGLSNWRKQLIQDLKNQLEGKDSKIFNKMLCKDKYYLKRKYLGENLTPVEIAKECGVSPRTIYSSLKENGLFIQGYNFREDNRAYRDKEWLQKRYIEENRSVTEIACECGVSTYTISDWLKRHGIRKRRYKRKVSNKRYKNKKWLKREYVEKGKTKEKIAKECKTSRPNIDYWINKYNIRKRKPYEYDPKYRNGKWLREEYLEKKRTIEDIANECGVKGATIRKWLDKNGLSSKFGERTGMKELLPQEKGEHQFKKFSKLFSYLLKELDIPLDTMRLRNSQREYHRVRDRIPKGYHLRALRRLGPIFAYMFLKINNIPINLTQVQSIFKIDHQEFQELLLRTLTYYPEFHTRNRVKLIKKRIIKCENHFTFGRTFLEISEYIFKAYFPYLQFTSEKLCASITVSLAILILDRKNPSINKVVKFMGSNSSSINNSVRRYIFKKRGLKGFSGLNKAREIIIEDLRKQGDGSQDLDLILAKNKTIEKDSVPIINSQKGDDSPKENLLSEENPFPHLGELVKIINTNVKCERCGSSVLKLEYRQKTLFLCKSCHKKN